MGVGAFIGNFAKGLSQNLQGKSATGSAPKKRSKPADFASKSDGDGFYGSDLTSYHKGGLVRKTGPARLKKGERVLTKTQAKKYRKRMSKKG